MPFSTRERACVQTIGIGVVVCVIVGSRCVWAVFGGWRERCVCGEDAWVINIYTSASTKYVRAGVITTCAAHTHTSEKDHERRKKRMISIGAGSRGSPQKRVYMVYSPTIYII